MRGHLHLIVADKFGKVIARRLGHNAVMRSGGELMARLFSGAASGITHMGVGTSEELDTENYATSALKNEAVADLAPLTGPTQVAIPSDAFRIVPDETKRVVKVSVRATLPTASAVGTIREAGLLSISETDTLLYNRIVFDPVNKGNDHELTMFWEVSFPYGDLQWF